MIVQRDTIGRRYLKKAARPMDGMMITILLLLLMTGILILFSATYYQALRKGDPLLEVKRQLIGVALGAAGVGKWVLSSQIGTLVSETISFVTAPVSGLILVIVGYELNFRREMMKPVMITVLLRILVMAVLLVLGSVVIFSIIPFDKPLFVALMLGYSLPAPFIIPLFADLGKDGEYISTALSMETIASILLFIGIAAYTLA